MRRGDPKPSVPDPSAIESGATQDPRDAHHVPRLLLGNRDPEGQLQDRFNLDRSAMRRGVSQHAVLPGVPNFKVGMDGGELRFLRSVEVGLDPVRWTV
jgi:hypothetical protein